MILRLKRNLPFTPQNCGMSPRISVATLFRWCEAFEFGGPVLDHHDARGAAWRLFVFQHQEALSVRADVVPRIAAGHRRDGELSLEEKRWRTGFKLVAPCAKIGKRLQVDFETICVVRGVCQPPAVGRDCGS